MCVAVFTQYMQCVTGCPFGHLFSADTVFHNGVVRETRMVELFVPVTPGSYIICLGWGGA